MLLFHVLAERFKLWGDHDQGGGVGFDLRQDFIQSFQLQNTVGSPEAAKEADDQGAAGEQGTGRDRLVVLVGKRK
jgi:hypothetical protein